METNFLSGSENLYKYLVTMGLLLIVMTVYYPLKEKQELELNIINTEQEAVTLNYNIKSVARTVNSLKNNVKSLKQDKDIKITIKNIENLLNENQISQYKLEMKYKEIKARKNHIKFYNILFWIFFPIGVLLTIFGFIKWLKSKIVDDEILKLEKRKLELEINELEDKNK